MLLRPSGVVRWLICDCSVCISYSMFHIRKGPRKYEPRDYLSTQRVSFPSVYSESRVQYCNRELTEFSVIEHAHCARWSGKGYEDSRVDYHLCTCVVRAHKPHSPHRITSVKNTCVSRGSADALHLLTVHVVITLIHCHFG